MSFITLRVIQERGLFGAFRQMYMMRTLKWGHLVGTDKAGNKYYENTVDYPHGQHRWVEYATGEGDMHWFYRSFYAVDASEVPAEWHSWLHHVTDAPPEPIPEDPSDLRPLLDKPSAPYETNLGGVIAEHTRNESSSRNRGYGFGNGVWQHEDKEERYYQQPGAAMSPRNLAAARAERWVSERGSRVPIAYTAESLQLEKQLDSLAARLRGEGESAEAVQAAVSAAREAALAGMTPEQREAAVTMSSHTFGDAALQFSAEEEAKLQELASRGNVVQRLGELRSEEAELQRITHKYADDRAAIGDAPFAQLDAVRAEAELLDGIMHKMQAMGSHAHAKLAGV